MDDLRRPFTDSLPPPVALRPMLMSLAGLAAFDFLAPGMLDEITSSTPMFAVLGIVAGQIPLVAVWAVFGPERFWRRWLSALAVICHLYVSLLAGMAVAGVPRSEVEVFSINLLMLPLVFLAGQLPLWLLRLGVGRGLSHDTAEAVSSDGGMQFGVRDLLTAFVVVGAALGLSRLAVLLHAMNGSDGQGMEPWLYLAMAATLLGVWSALLALPCMWAAFLAYNRNTASLVVTVYVLIVAFLAAVILGAMSGAGLIHEVLLSLLAFHAGSLAVILAGCRLLGSWGYSIRGRGVQP